jgi:hypothetical protein
MKKTVAIGIIAVLLCISPNLVSAGISYNAGTNLITLDNDAADGHNWANAFDMEDVLAAAGAVVTKQGANAYDVSARMRFISGVYFVSKNEFVELKPNPTNPSYTIYAEANSHIQLGDYNSSDKYSYDGSFWRIYTNANSGTKTNNFLCELLIYGSNIWTDTSNHSKGLHFVAGAKIRLYDSIHKHPSYFWAIDTDVQNVKWDGTGGVYDMLVASGPNFNWAGLTTSGCKKGFFFSATTSGNVDVYDAKLLNTGYYDVMVSTGISSSWLIRVINTPTFVTCNTPGSGKKGVQRCYTFNVKVTDDTGDPIVGATVFLKDADGNNAFPPEQTIAGGVLASDKVVKEYWFRHADQGGNKDYNDHTLKVVNGTDVTEYKITIDHQISEDVVLLPQSNATYDDLYIQNNLLLEEEKMIGTTVLFGIVVFLALLFLVLAVFGVGRESYFDILSAFISPTILMLIGYQCYVSEALQQFEFLGMLFIVIAVIIYIYAIIKVFQLAIEEFGYGEREEERGADYEYK